MSCFASLPCLGNCLEIDNTLSQPIPPPLGQEALALSKTCSDMLSVLLTSAGLAKCFLLMRDLGKNRRLFLVGPKPSRFSVNVGKKNEQKKTYK